MNYISHTGDGRVNLQATLSAASSDSIPFIGPHHPISCISGTLGLDEDGTMWCEHAQAGPDVLRNQTILDASIAILLIELLWERETKKPSAEAKGLVI